MPHISVIVPARNSEETLESCLKAVKRSNYTDYELIIVNSGSQERTSSIANRYADKVIEFPEGRQRSHTRAEGIKAATGRIMVNIDSDVAIKPDTLTKIDNFFSENQDVDAITGCLSKEHPNQNFFSQYKNLYMHYIFRRLPENITFLYGSIYAMRGKILHLYDSNIKIADDTALGQKFVSYGKKIVFLRDLEVTHFKKYNFFSFFKNDFQIPFDWAKIFLKFRGWRQLARNKTGYAHSPKEQLASVILAPTIFLLVLGTVLGYNFIPIISLLTLIWLFLNLGFLAFLAKEKGLIFGVLASIVTFFDNIVMALGIMAGFATFLFRS